MLNSLRKLFWISRPISWPNTAYPFAATYIIAGGNIDATLLLGTLYFLIPYNLLMYGVNDVYDYESDIKNPRKGGIEGMREARAFHPTILKAAIWSNIPFLIYLFLQGTIVSRFVLAAVVFFVIAYSLKGLRFKEKPVLDSITSSLHFVGPMVYALSLVGFSSQAWIVVAAFFVWGVASQAWGAVQDIIPDRAGDLKSIATFLGARRTVWLALILYMIATGIVVSQGTLSYAVVGVCGLFYVLNLVPYVRVVDAESAQVNKAWRRFLYLNLFTGFIVTMVLLGVFGGL